VFATNRATSRDTTLSLEPFDFINEPDPFLARQRAIAYNQQQLPGSFNHSDSSSDDSAYQPGPSTSSSSSLSSDSVPVETNDSLEDLLADADDIINALTQPLLPSPLNTIQPLFPTVNTLTLTTMANPAPLAPIPMPLPRSKLAPHYDGKPRHLRTFLREYETAANAAQLQDPDYTNRVIDYVKPKVGQYWSRFAEYKDAAKNWAIFKAAILSAYPEADEEHQYTLKELRKLVKWQHRKSIKSVPDLASYHRKFTEIATWLIDKQRISEIERNRLYLDAFRNRLHQGIENRLQVLNPQQDPSVPFDLGTVYNAALYLLRQGGKIKAKSSRNHSSSGSDSDSDTDSEDDEARSSSEGSDDGRKPKKRSTQVPPSSAATISPLQPISIKQEDPTSATLERLMQQMIQHQQNQTKALTAAIASATSALSGSKVPPVTVITPTPTISTAMKYTGCSFCGIDGHFIQQCPTVEEYVKAGKAGRDANGKVVTITGRFIPRGTPGQTLKDRLDSWLSQNASRVPTASANIVETLFLEGELTHPQVEDGSDAEAEFIHRLEILATELQKDRQNKKKGKPSVEISQAPAPEPPKNTIRIPPRPKPATAPTPNPTIAPPPSSILNPPPMVPAKPDEPIKPRYKLQSPADDAALNEETMRMILDGKLDERLTVKHMLAASPPLRAKFNSYLKNQRVEINPQSTNVVDSEIAHYERRINQNGLIVGHSSVPLREVPVLINNAIWERALLDEGSTICVIRKDLWQEIGAHADPTLVMRMEGANSDVATTLGEVRDLSLTFGPITVYIQFQIVMRAPFRMLLGRPFFSLTTSTYDNIENQGAILTIRDPNDRSKVLAIPTMERTSNRREEDSSFFIKGK
jgi:hypothetical protein